MYTKGGEDKRTMGRQRLYEEKPVRHKPECLEGRLEPPEVFQVAKGLEGGPEGGERCFKCYRLRLEEAAKMDGCSPWKTLWKIIFPIAAPGIFASAILTFISAWNEYLLSLTLNSDVSWMSVPVRIASLQNEYTIYWGQITAAAALVTIPTLIIVMLF